MRLFLLATLALLLEHLLDDLLLLDQEGADDAVTHAVAASRATVGALDGLLGVADLRVLAGAQGGDLRRNNALDNWLVGIPRRQAERRPRTWRPTRNGTEEVGAKREVSRRVRSPLNRAPKPNFPHPDPSTPPFLGRLCPPTRCIGLEVLVQRQLTPGSLLPQSPHLGAVPRLRMCRVRSSPPGVRTTRVLLDVVL